jgi:hypothetical protein
VSEVRPVATWIKVFLGVQLALATLFFLLAWSHTVSLAQGRAASLRDLAGLALPLALVVAAWAGSVVLWRRGQRALAGLLTIAPWPLALVVFILLGAV